jgi:ATP/maltotriose-dependent transcriptional regulator MalT
MKYCDCEDSSNVTITRTARVNTEDDFSVRFFLSEAARAPKFIARNEELTEIHEALCGDESGRAVVLHGLGGIGKTQLAIAYAMLHQASYSAVFWMNIKDETSIKESFARAARRILSDNPTANQLAIVDEKKSLDEIVVGVKQWLCLRKNTRWLLVYDNYDNPNQGIRILQQLMYKCFSLKHTTARS